MASQWGRIHLEEGLKWTGLGAANQFDYDVNGVFRYYGCGRVELEDGSSDAVAMWEMMRRWKRTGVASSPTDLNLTD